MNQLNTTTRRYPRTMNEAFGAYHHLAPLQTEYMPMHKHDTIILCGCAFALIVLSIIVVIYG